MKSRTTLWYSTTTATHRHTPSRTPRRLLLLFHVSAAAVKQFRARSQAAFARTAVAADMSTLLAWCSEQRPAASDQGAAAAAADMSSEIMMAAVGVEFGKPLVSVAARLQFQSNFERLTIVLQGAHRLPCPCQHRRARPARGCCLRRLCCNQPDRLQNARRPFRRPR